MPLFFRILHVGGVFPGRVKGKWGPNGMPAVAGNCQIGRLSIVAQSPAQKDEVHDEVAPRKASHLDED